MFVIVSELDSELKLVCKNEGNSVKGGIVTFVEKHKRVVNIAVFFVLRRKNLNLSAMVFSICVQLTLDVNGKNAPLPMS